MNERTKTGFEILQASLLVGVLGNILLRQTPWGLNAFLFVTTFIVVVIVLLRRRRPELLSKTTLALCGAMVFFASMFLIRDSIELRVYDTFAILIIMGVLLLSNLDIKAHVGGAFHYAVGFVWSGLTSVFGPLILLGSDIEWKGAPGNKLTAHLFSVFRGLAIALPLVLVFGGLFMAADAVFEGLVNRAVHFEIDVVISHIVLTAVFAWLTAGYLRGAVIPPMQVPITGDPTTGPAQSTADASSSYVEKVAAEGGQEAGNLPDNATILEHINRSDPPATAVVPAQKKKRDWQNIDSSSLAPVFTLGMVETVIILGLVNLLFLAFVIVQVPYLFGGMDLVQNTPDFKLAEYARRGFGELVAVAALVLPMLLVSHWLLRRETGMPEKIFRVFAGVQIGLLFVIMASAVQRLVLLTGEHGYGLTTVRFYPMVFMIWLAVVFGWFALTVLRGARKHFAWGALWSAIVILGATNLMNPDAFIVRTNLNLMQQGRDFDPYYNSRLSDDAVPALLEAQYLVNADCRCAIVSELHQHLSDKRRWERDLRSWNWSRAQATTLLGKDTVIPDADSVSATCAVRRVPAP